MLLRGLEPAWAHSAGFNYAAGDCRAGTTTLFNTNRQVILYVRWTWTRKSKSM